MFDEFLRAEHPDQGEFTSRRLRPLRRRQAARDGVRDFLATRDIAPARGRPDDAPTRETVQGIGRRKNDLRAARRSTDHGVEVYPGSVRYLDARRPRRACAGRSCRPAPTAGTCSPAAGIERPARGAGRRRRRRARAPARASRHRTRSWPPPGASASSRPRRRCSRTRWPASQAGRAGGLRLRRRGRPGRRPGRRAARPRRRRRRRPTSPNCSPRQRAGDRRIPPSRSSPGRCARPASTSTVAGPDRVAVRARPTATSGCAGNLDEGEPLRPARAPTSTRFYELRPLPYAEAGYGYPESGQTVVNVTNGKLIRLLVDDEPFDVRYGELHQHERVLDLRAGTLRRTVDWRSPAGRRGAGPLDPAGVAHPARGRRHRYEVRGRSTSRPGMVVQSELVANEAAAQPHAGDPRVAAVARPAAGSPRSTAAHGRRASSCTAPRAAACGWPRRWTTSSKRPPGTSQPDRGAPRLGPDHRRPRACRRAEH